MAGQLARFGVSLERALLGELDALMKGKGYTNRSEYIRDLVRDDLVRKRCKAGGEVAGAIMLLYDHHRRELVNVLTDIQHEYHGLIVSGQHIHLDHHNCLEIIAVKGHPVRIEELADRMRAAKGVKHGSLTITSTGKGIA
ncbi:MAG: nickel-responsive transcriptional regulator NikR [Deltaproteobacteria bacterium]